MVLLCHILILLVAVSLAAAACGGNYRLEAGDKVTIDHINNSGRNRKCTNKFRCTGSQWDCNISIKCTEFNFAAKKGEKCKGNFMRVRDGSYWYPKSCDYTGGPDMWIEWADKVTVMANGKDYSFTCDVTMEGTATTTEPATTYDYGDWTTDGSGWTDGPTAPVWTGTTPPSGGGNDNSSCCATYNPSKTRIVGGVTVTKGEVPWQVALKYYGWQFCGGTLISDQWVLTAKHCVEDWDKADLTVSVGDHNINNPDGEIDFAVNKIELGPDTYTTNDIALLKLKGKVTFGKGVRPACIPTAHQNNKFEGESLWVSGWGTVDYGGSSPAELKKVKVPVVSNEDCKTSYGNYIEPGMICAGTKGKDSCQGDSGGPAVWSDGPNHRAYIIGVVSTGYGCGYDGYPGVYARVTSYLDWISSTTSRSATCNPDDGAVSTAPPVVTTPATGSTTPSDDANNSSCCATFTPKNTRIVGGVTVDEGEVPWQVALKYYDSQFCGGTLISESWVVTAKHCIFSGLTPDTLTVTVGDHHIDDDDGEIDMAVSEWVFPPDTYSSNDIALLKLKSKAVFTESVRPACLPGAADTFEGKSLWVTGWGTLDYGGDSPALLQKVKVPVVSNEDCKTSYGNYIEPGMICAGTKGKDSCQGDSGGPAVYADGPKNRALLVGVVSSGRGCGDDGYPGIYVRVTAYLDWIHSTIRGSGGCNANSSSSTTAAPAASTTKATTAGDKPTTPAGGNTNSSCNCATYIPDPKDVRIVGGQVVDKGEFPWQVAIRSVSSGRQFCGGTLISPSWVLSARHCLVGDEPGDVKVTLGDHHIHHDDGEIEHMVEKIIMGETSSGSNDIALLKLTTKAAFTDRVKAACLPTSLADPSLQGESIWLTGWGTTQSQGSQSDTLLKVNVPVVSNEKCQENYAGDGYTIHDNEICAGSPGKDSCQGDSGGPAVWVGPDHKANVVGVVSWGVGCGWTDYPGVYVRVSSFLDWIKSNIGSESCDGSSGTSSTANPAPVPSTTKAPTTAASATSAGPANPSCCAKYDPNPSETKIVGGNVVKKGDFPWQVAIRGKSSGRQFCGGTLISEYWVLTAQHCLVGDEPGDIKVTLGDHNMTIGAVDIGETEHDVTQIVMGPTTYAVNDIALIKLKTKAEFSSHIQKACLPTSLAGTSLENEHLWVSGWGTLASGGSQPDLLMSVKVPVVSNTKCAAAYAGDGYNIDDSEICAGSTGKDSCQGDSGGPAVWADGPENRAYVVGVVSWGIGCGFVDYPGVYVRVTSWLDWIKKTTADDDTVCYGASAVESKIQIPIPKIPQIPRIQV